MKKVKEIYYIDNREERLSDFSTGFLFVLEDGSKVETMTTDPIAERYTKSEPKECEFFQQDGDKCTQKAVENSIGCQFHNDNLPI